MEWIAALRLGVVTETMRCATFTLIGDGESQDKKS